VGRPRLAEWRGRWISIWIAEGRDYRLGATHRLELGDAQRADGELANHDIRAGKEAAHSLGRSTRHEGEAPSIASPILRAHLAPVDHQHAHAGMPLEKALDASRSNLHTLAGL